MGEHMFNFSINNIASVIDVRRAISVGLPHASNELIEPPTTLKKQTDADLRHPLFQVPRNKIIVNDTAETINPLLALFHSFVTKLLKASSVEEDKTVPVIPTPAPEITPQVLPQPAELKPNPVASIPGLSSKRGGAKPDNIWSGFHQGSNGNCVTVSCIKTAMQRFGQSPTDIYKQVTRISGGYRVVMRDDVQVTLTDSELAQGARGARFKGGDEGMLKDAQFLFAVSAKRAQMEDNDGTAGSSYQAAIRSLNNGEDERGPGEAYLRLGLRQHMKRVPVRELARGQLGMCNRNGHSVAVINGREELWGHKGPAPTRGQAVALV